MNQVKIILSFVLILGAGNFLELCSQTYTPMVKEGATWINYFIDEFPQTLYTAYKIEGDTTINSIEYKKLYFYDLAPNQTDPFIVVFKRIWGLLREDIEAKRVYSLPIAQSLYSPPWGKFKYESCFGFDVLDLKYEVLLYDFNQTIGDTIDNCHLDDMEMDKTIVNDYVDFRFGADRRVIVNESNIELIEGIGYSNGFLVEASTVTIAGREIGLYDYCDNQNISCALTTNVQEQNKVDFTVFPNPASNEIRVLGTEGISQLILSDMSGRVVQTAALSLLSIDESVYPGIYLLSVKYFDGKTANKLINIVNF